MFDIFSDCSRLITDLSQTMLNLLEAYAVSVKHYLRGETGIHYEDLYHLVLFLPKVDIRIYAMAFRD